MKNKLLAAVLIIALFIPSVVAIVSYVTSDKSTVVSADLADVVTIADLDGKEFVFKSDTDDGKAIISQLRQMIENAEDLPSLPEAIAGDSFYKVTFSVDKLETVYKFYFAADGKDTYLVTSDGDAKRVTSELTEEFLATDFAQSIYASSHSPVLTLSGEYTVAPIAEGDLASSWMYKNSTGTFVAATLDGSEGDESYEVEGGLSLAFDNEPDNLAVKVLAQNGDELFNDQYSAIGSLTLEPGTTVTVDIAAKWYEEDDRDYYGTLNYSFTATVSAPAEFYPGVKTIERGGIVSITAINVNTPSKITVTCEPELELSPVWYRDGDYARTLIAFGPETEVGTYTLTFEYAGSKQPITLELTTRNFKPRPYEVDETVFADHYTESARDEFAAEAAKIMKESASERLWDGAFMHNPTSGLSESLWYGPMLNFSNAAISERHDGVDYSGSGDVLAANSGKVVYVGDMTFPGKFVVIDHGWGLKTWYSHLSSVTVEVGDEVKKGDKIGVSGDTGFTGAVGVHVSMTLWDQVIMPYSTWDDNYDEGYVAGGVSVGIPMYEK